jgi:hypothetical protein
MFGTRRGGSFCRGGDLMLYCIVIGAVGGVVVLLFTRGCSR